MAIPVGVKVAGGIVGGLAVLAGVVALARARKGGDADKAAKDAEDAKLAAQADQIFSGALVSANGIVSASAAAGTLGIGAAAAAPLQVTASAAVGTAWTKMSVHDKAEVMRGGGPSAVQAIAAASATPAPTPTPTPTPAPTEAPLSPSPRFAVAGLNGLRPWPTTNGYLVDFGFSNPFRTKSGKLPGCERPSPGLQSVVCWAAQGISDQLHGMMGKLCDSADTAYRSLKDRGVPVPGNWTGLSCDQKAAFLLALGTTLGIALPVLLVAGAIGAALKSKQVAQLASAVSGAANKVGGAVAAGMKAAEDAAAHVVEQITHPHLFGVEMHGASLGACACQVMRRGSARVSSSMGDYAANVSAPVALPSANLPGSAFATPAGVVPTAATARVWTSHRSIALDVPKPMQPKKPEFPRFNVGQPTYLTLRRG